MTVNRPHKKGIKSISSEGVFTDQIELKGYFNLSLSGEWIGIVTIQRSFDKGDTWFDVKVLEINEQEFGFEPEGGVYYRGGFKVGEYTSGTAHVRLSQ